MKFGMYITAFLCICLAVIGAISLSIPWPFIVKLLMSLICFLPGICFIDVYIQELRHWDEEEEE